MNNMENLEIKDIKFVIKRNGDKVLFELENRVFWESIHHLQSHEAYCFDYFPSFFFSRFTI